MQPGVNVSATENVNKVKKSDKDQSIINCVKNIVYKSGLNDDSWAKAISSQYFLLCLAKQLGLTKKDYKDLINRCLEPLNFTYDSSFVLDDKKILITPEETELILKCMKEEDNEDPCYKRSTKLRAANIDANMMYLNFHYGLLVRNVSAEKTDVLERVKNLCIDKLCNESAIDTSGGWYPYRVPWITGRILVSLRAINFKGHPKEEDLTEDINEAIESLYRRINTDGTYWRSGVGEWVSKWESTALCLEALYAWESIKFHTREIGKIVNYVIDDNQLSEWLECKVDFSDEKSANKVLASVTLASVIYRITRKYYPDEFAMINDKLVAFFEAVVKEINKKSVFKSQQYCTIPQILHYVVAAFETN